MKYLIIFNSVKVLSVTAHIPGTSVLTSESNYTLVHDNLPFVKKIFTEAGMQQVTKLDEFI